VRLDSRSRILGVNHLDISLHQWPSSDALTPEHRAAVEDFHRKIESGEIDAELIEAFQPFKTGDAIS
jgi:hypothetical protein